MKPVQQMGVFHDANGSMPANVAVCEMRMMASPVSPYLSTTGDTEDIEE